MFDLSIPESECGARAYCGRCPECMRALDTVLTVQPPCACCGDATVPPTRALPGEDYCATCLEMAPGLRAGCIVCKDPSGVRCCEYGRAA